MTIQMATRDFPTHASPSGQERITEASIGIDLTLLGAACSGTFGTVLPIDYADFPQLLSSAHAALRGGVDFVSLDRTFHSRSDAPRPLDAVKVAARMLSQVEGGITAEVPSAVEAIDAAVDMLSRSGQGRAAVAIELAADCDLATIASAAERAEDAGVHFAVKAKVDAFTFADIQAVARFADVVYLLTDDPHRARESRFALRSAAAELGRELTVLAEMGILVSRSVPAARERSLLVETMTGKPVFEGKASVVGTVYDAADAVEEWIGLGAADGIVFLPASLPTDLASVIRGIMPLLHARGIDIAHSYGEGLM